MLSIYAARIITVILLYLLLRMNVLFQLVFLWIPVTFIPCFMPLVYCSHVDHDEIVITIDETGISSAECCVFGKCYCSNLSLALEYIQSDTIIRMMSNVSLQGATWFEGTNNTTVTLETFKNIFDKVDWLQEFTLQFTLVITECLNNLYGPRQVFTCCGYHNCNERYEYIIDSIHHNVTMISSETIANCPGSEMCALQLVATAGVYNDIHYGLMYTHINIKIPLTKKLIDDCTNDIAHFSKQRFCYNRTTASQACLPLSCDHDFIQCLPNGIHCCSSYGSNYFTVAPGYWFSDGFTEFVDDCPPGHCNINFSLFDKIEKNGSSPISNDQCVFNWTGLACGECDEDNYIIHDSTSCVPSDKCTLKDSFGLILFFFASLLYWVIVISFIFVLLHFKFNITAGYAYGIIFYYSVLEQTVHSNDTYNDYDAPMINVTLILLSSIGNMKPPFQFLKLCFWKNASKMDHMFLTYIHPVIVISLIVTIFLLARNSVTVARTVGRYVNSKSICILLMLSYSSVSYTSVQLLRPLEIHKYIDEKGFVSSWHLYLSPKIEYFGKHHNYIIAYFIIALLFELIIGIGFPFVLLFQRYLTRYCKISFTCIKPVMDQFKGCYKEKYHWFAAYYLLCRQAIYVMDIATDFASNFKFAFMLIIYAVIVIVHIGFQPYKERKLNVLDSYILMTLMIVYIGEHTTYGSTVILWILPLVLFINCVAFSTKFKYFLIPVSCVAMIIFCTFFKLCDIYYALDDDPWREFSVDVVILLSSLVLLAYIIYICKFCFAFIKRRCKHQPQAPAQCRLININEQNEDSHEYGACDSNQSFPIENTPLKSQQYYGTFRSVNETSNFD